MLPKPRQFTTLSRAIQTPNDKIKRLFKCFELVSSMKTNGVGVVLKIKMVLVFFLLKPTFSLFIECLQNYYSVEKHYLCGQFTTQFITIQTPNDTVCTLLIIRYHSSGGIQYIMKMLVLVQKKLKNNFIFNTTKIKKHQHLWI